MTSPFILTRSRRRNIRRMSHRTSGFWLIIILAVHVAIVLVALALTPFFK